MLDNKAEAGRDCWSGSTPKKDKHRPWTQEHCCHHHADYSTTHRVWMRQQQYVRTG